MLVIICDELEPCEEKPDVKKSVLRRKKTKKFFEEYGIPYSILAIMDESSLMVWNYSIPWVQLVKSKVPSIN